MSEPLNRLDDASALESRQADDQRLYQLAYDVLRRHIVGKQLPLGLVLLESRIAELLDISRAPVRRALELLLRDGLVRRFEGRGYLVGGSEPTQAPLRIDLSEAGFIAPAGMSESIGLFTWERIYREVETAVGRTIPFGTYRVIEAAITARFGVSRTVAREVLSRLRDRGLIQKNRWSTWIAGPLTAQTVDECFAIRILLEPQALQEATRSCKPTELAVMHERLTAALASGTPSRAEVDQLEDDLHRSLLRMSSNQRMLGVIEESQMPMVINQLFDEHFGPTDHRVMLSEHRMVIEHLRLENADVAAAALAAHLDAARQRTKARLKVLAVIPSPETGPFLERIH
jgi:DNA-binding GntR family transcriptional regulator